MDVREHFMAEIALIDFLASCLPLSAPINATDAHHVRNVPAIAAGACTKLPVEIKFRNRPDFYVV